MGFLSFNDIQSDYYQIPKSDIEKLKKEEEREREELQKESAKEEEKNISEGNLDINDPVEVRPEIENEINSSEELNQEVLTNNESSNEERAATGIKKQNQDLGQKDIRYKKL